MPSTKEQMNVWISKETIDKARKCATVQQTSLNQWVQRAIEAQAEQDYETFQIEKLAAQLDEVARRHLVVQPVGKEQMLAIAKVFAREDDDDGLRARHVSTTPRRKTPRPAIAPCRTRRR